MNDFHEGGIILCAQDIHGRQMEPICHLAPWRPAKHRGNLLALTAQLDMADI